MSKERELLMRWLSGEANEMTTHIPLLIETQNLLAQPEQEPTTRHAFDSYWNQEAYQRVYAEAKLKLKREPLSNLAIKEASRNAKDMSFYNGVKWAEQEHKIGIDYE